MQARLLLAAAGWGVLAFQSGVARGADEVSPAADAAAQEAYLRAELAYRDKDLPGALRDMEEAYRLSQRPDLLYNLARIEDELGQCEPARVHYQAYLERVPQGEAREDAKVANERLETRCGPVPAAPESAPPPVVAPPPPGPPPVLVPARSSAPLPPPHDGSTQRWLGWSLVAGGVVAGVGAAFFLDAAIDSRNALQASVNAQVAGGPRYDPGLRDDQHGHERTARALGVSSAALLVGGAVVVLLAPKDSGAGRRAALQLEPGLYAATYGQSF